MDRLRTPIHGRITRAGHLLVRLEVIFNIVWDIVTIVWDNVVLRTLAFGFLGDCIGVVAQDMTGPFVVTWEKKILFSVSAPVTAATWCAILGLSARLFFDLVLIGAWEWVGIFVVVGMGLATALHSLAGRLAIAFSRLVL